MMLPLEMSLQLIGRTAAVWCSAAAGGFCSLTQLAAPNKNAKGQKGHPCLQAPWRNGLSRKKSDMCGCTLYKPPLNSAAFSASPIRAPAESKKDNSWAESLQKKFAGSKAVRFQQKGNLVMMELKAEKGSTARMLLPQGLITSYKPSMWHGGFEEMLHIETSEVDGVPKAEGGIGLNFSYADGEPGSILSESSQIWELEDILEEPSGTVQVMLMCRIPGCGKQGHDVLSLHYIVTLSQTMLASAIAVSNIGRSTMKFTGSVFSYVALSDIEGTYVVGLKGCRYSSVPTASESTKKYNIFHAIGQIWSDKINKNQNKLEDISFSSQQLGTDHATFVPRGMNDLMDWAVEKEDYAGLSDGMKRLYMMLNDSCMLLDRGKRRSLVFRRVGFSDLWLCNPGRKSGKRDWDKIACIGPASAHQPVVLEPGQEWRAAQVIQNLNA
ncbi:hypothetical protein O6H91_23G036000 [Diphasiastrum complanatum]|uniref:Uncharacterized protein n=1 Tax=Diphasiastrum complanatum TaxID=34168 RepID=A0ACC2A9Q5_DIPCM|nr:hypothetical protein O6H91_23G036000 [Diphasiastrum complanatum]